MIIDLQLEITKLRDQNSALIKISKEALNHLQVLSSARALELTKTLDRAIENNPEQNYHYNSNRKHLVESAGFWFKGAYEKASKGQYHEALFCMENAYNHVENAVYAYKQFHEQKNQPSIQQIVEKETI